jgi:hypothetical protein
MLDILVEVFIDKVVAFLEFDPTFVIQTAVETLPERQIGAKAPDQCFWDVLVGGEMVI